MSGITGQLTNALAGRYRIEKHLGEGGMATVYLARDLKHDRHVALKVLRPELAAVVGAERFLTEIKVTANLQHPHILPLHDSGEAEGFLFYVMPFVEDDTLRDKLDREKQLGIEEAVEITRSIAAALDYAHRQGVIHRDIKPANILMHEGQPMIADFGIALAVSQASDQRLTETGLSIGTPHYMSPEQAMGDRELDPRSDVYSLGAMLYEMIAGEPPYTGSTAQAIVAKVITSKPTLLREARDTVPLNVEAAVAKALHKSPADRFGSAADFAKALGDPGYTLPLTAGTTVGTAAAPAPPPSRRPTVIVAAGTAVVALAVGLYAGLVLAPEPDAPVAHFRVDLPDEVIGVSACCGPQEAMSPDGEWLVYRGFAADGVARLYRRRRGQLESEPIPGTEGASQPFFSPDGLWVGFWSDLRLRKVAMGGGPAVPITDAANPGGASWGDNDVIVFSSNNTGDLYTVPASSGAPTQVPNPSGGAYFHPAVLPGGGAVVARRRGGSTPDDAQVVVVDLQTGEATELGYATRVAYASGHLILSGADGTLLVQPFDPRSRKTTGQAVAILAGIGRGGGAQMGEFAVSQQGSLAYQTTTTASGEDLIISGPGGAASVALPQAALLEGPTFSPDGRRIAMEVTGSGIWIWDRDQETHELLVPDGRSPVWSPDGSRIAFGLRSDLTQILWMPADGSGPAEVLIDSVNAAGPASFSPDGTVLAFRSVTSPDATGDRNIGFLTIASGEIRWFVEDDAGETQPIISPDGRWVAYASDRSGQSEVYVRAFDGSGGRTQISAEGGDSPRWHPDGNVIYYVTGPGAPVTAASLSIADGSVRVRSREPAFSGIQDINPTTEVNWDIGPDGTEFLFIGQSDSGVRPGFAWVLNWPGLAKRMAGGR